MVIAKSKEVKPQMNNTIKSMDTGYWSPGSEPSDNEEAGVPRAIFIPHTNSLPFEERRVTLEQPVKIGRNVYRATPSPTNTIFECRVLSRHHATIYYEKGHFYLVDNQSSNGTFINNNRCSISKEPHEVFSGDIVKFGISVVENNTYPPVIALLKLYHPDGKEAKLSFNPTMTTPLHLKELYQLNNYVQEAIQREATLESRLQTLRECVERTRESARQSWELFVGEQRLLMRVRTLENMLAVGKQPEQQHVTQLLDEKKNYQEVAQESLRAAHEQRLALEESLERRSREAHSLYQHNCSLRLQANKALTELQKLAARCERKMCAARLAISTAEQKEAAVRTHLPLTYSIQNGEAKMLVVSSDSDALSDDNRGALEEAIRTLPDYIKLLLPEHVLHKVGLKAISAEGKTAKEFELILKTNNIYDTESREKQATEESVSGVSVSGEQKDIFSCTVKRAGGDKGEEKASAELEPKTDDEKRERLNHETTTTQLESSPPLDGDLCEDNNANSTYDSDNRDDSPNKGGIEYANILCVMSGLNDEIKALRERLQAASAENEQLRNIRDELLAANAEQKEEMAVEPEDAATYQAKIEDLQARLTRSTVAQEANLAEIQRLTSSTAVMQAELSFRPTKGDYDDLNKLVAKLNADIQAKDDALLRLKVKETEEKATETGDLEPEKSEIDVGKVSAEIDDLFRLDDEDEETTDSAATEVIADITDPGQESVGDYLKLPDEERLQVTLANGSFHALEEELVRAKERWAEVNEERARLAAQLQALQVKQSVITPARILAIAVPIFAVVLYWILYPYIS